MTAGVWERLGNRNGEAMKERHFLLCFFGLVLSFGIMLLFHILENK